MLTLLAILHKVITLSHCHQLIGQIAFRMLSPPVDWYFKLFLSCKLFPFPVLQGSSNAVPFAFDLQQSCNQPCISMIACCCFYTVLIVASRQFLLVESHFCCSNSSLSALPQADCCITEFLSGCQLAISVIVTNWSLHSIVANATATVKASEFAAVEFSNCLPPLLLHISPSPFHFSVNVAIAIAISVNMASPFLSLLLHCHHHYHHWSHHCHALPLQSPLLPLPSPLQSPLSPLPSPWQSPTITIAITITVTIAVTITVMIAIAVAVMLLMPGDCCFLINFMVIFPLPLPSLSPLPLPLPLPLPSLSCLHCHVVTCKLSCLASCHCRFWIFEGCICIFLFDPLRRFFYMENCRWEDQMIREAERALKKEVWIPVCFPTMAYE